MGKQVPTTFKYVHILTMDPTAHFKQFANDPLTSVTGFGKKIAF